MVPLKGNITITHQLLVCLSIACYSKLATLQWLLVHVTSLTPLEQMLMKDHLTIQLQIFNYSNSSQWDNALKNYYKNYHSVSVSLDVSQLENIDNYAMLRLEEYHSTISINITSKNIPWFLHSWRLFVHWQSYQLCKGSRL